MLPLDVPVVVGLLAGIMYIAVRRYLVVHTCAFMQGRVTIEGAQTFWLWVGVAHLVMAVIALYAVYC